jgi:hypothetical protein
VLYQEEVEALILRLASSFPARKDQLLFLINNYDVVMSIIIERTRDDSKVTSIFFFLCDLFFGSAAFLSGFRRVKKCTRNR